jgi:hypothetical protein
MDFHIVKMYKDKVSTKMSNIFFYQCVTKSVFQIYFTECGAALTTVLSENCENRNDPDLVQAFL